MPERPRACLVAEGSGWSARSGESTDLRIAAWLPARHKQIHRMVLFGTETLVQSKRRAVIVVDTIPVCVFVAVTITPGISALEASDTVPPSVAFVV